jgi:predicted chitinase
MLTKDLLAKLCPRPRQIAKAKIWDGYVSALVSPEANILFRQFGITSKARMAHLLAQWAHESGGFTIVWESGAYSASRIMQIFGVGRHSAKVTAAEAQALAHNGKALFERVYGLGNPAKAKELGNTQKGDGWRFRGCGIVQLTGRAAHERYARKIGCSVDEIDKPINSIHGALLEWKEKNCNRYADQDNVLRVTKLVNGGQNGLNGRKVYLDKAKTLLGDSETKLPDKAPKKTVRETVKESPSLRMMFNALFAGIVAAVLSALQWVGEWAGWLVSLLPLAADDVSSAVGSLRTMGEYVDVDIPIKILLGVAVTCIILVFRRQLEAKRSEA